MDLTQSSYIKNMYGSQTIHASIEDKLCLATTFAAKTLPRYSRPRMTDEKAIKECYKLFASIIMLTKLTITIELYIILFIQTKLIL